jgi:hypothetical protein
VATARNGECVHTIGGIANPVFTPYYISRFIEFSSVRGTCLAAMRGCHSVRTIEQQVREIARAEHIKENAMADVLTMATLELHVAEDGSIQTADGGDLASWVEGRKSLSPYWWPTSKGVGARGSDAGDPMSSADNPFLPGPGFSLTKAGDLIRSNPKRATALQAAANAAAAMSRQ